MCPYTTHAQSYTLEYNPIKAAWPHVTSGDVGPPTPCPQGLQFSVNATEWHIADRLYHFFSYVIFCLFINV